MISVKIYQTEKPEARTEVLGETSRTATGTVALPKTHFDGAHFRRDIGSKAL
jgi:hypothetical protein